jgi:hypothetical protein
MRLRVIRLTSVLAAAWLTGACSAATEQATAPTSLEPSSGQSRETSPWPPPAPPSADRGQVPPLPAPPPAPPALAECHASKAQSAIGERARPETLERARVAAGAKSARFLRPNQAVTLEYLSSRLNLYLNEQDVVRSVSCG